MDLSLSKWKIKSNVLLFISVSEEDVLALLKYESSPIDDPSPQSSHPPWNYTADFSQTLSTRKETLRRYCIELYTTEAK